MNAAVRQTAFVIGWLCCGGGVWLFWFGVGMLRKWWLG